VCQKILTIVPLLLVIVFVSIMSHQLFLKSVVDQKAQRDDDGNVIVRNSTFAQAKSTVMALHDKLGCNGAFPTRRQFTENGEQFLYNHISGGTRFKCSFQSFVEKCGLTCARISKRRRTLSPSF